MGALHKEFVDIQAVEAQLSDLDSITGNNTNAYIH
jgi:hypothetical protein